jgi:hypothetical protein
MRKAALPAFVSGQLAFAKRRSTSSRSPGSTAIKGSVADGADVASSTALRIAYSMHSEEETSGQLTPMNTLRTSSLMRASLIDSPAEDGALGSSM